MSEGTIGDEYHGREFFDFSKIDIKKTAFTSGILLFNNCIEVKTLFKNILFYINLNISNNGIKPIAYDQAFLNYHAIINNLYNNTLLNEYSINNPGTFDYKYVLCHFPGGVGNYENKFDKMSYYLLHLFDTYNFQIINNYDCKNLKKKYCWKHDKININGYIEFSENNELITPWGNGKYEILNGKYIKTFWFKDCHLLIFDDNLEKFISIRRMDNNISSGEVVNE